MNLVPYIVSALGGAFVTFLIFFVCWSMEDSRFEREVNLPGSRVGAKIRLPMSFRRVSVTQDCRADIRPTRIGLEVSIIDLDLWSTRRPV